MTEEADNEVAQELVREAERASLRASLREKYNVAPASDLAQKDLELAEKLKSSELDVEHDVEKKPSMANNLVGWFKQSIIELGDEDDEHEEVVSVVSVASVGTTHANRPSSRLGPGYEPGRPSDINGMEEDSRRTTKMSMFGFNTAPRNTSVVHQQVSVERLAQHMRQASVAIETKHMDKGEKKKMEEEQKKLEAELKKLEKGRKAMEKAGLMPAMVIGPDGTPIPAMVPVSQDAKESIVRQTLVPGGPAPEATNANDDEFYAQPYYDPGLVPRKQKSGSYWQMFVCY